MCMQCMATAMTAGAASTGMRAWLATHKPRRMSPLAMKRVSAGLLIAGVLAAGVHGSPAHPPAAAAAYHPHHVSR
jgi:hypothetical protein